MTNNLLKHILLSMTLCSVMVGVKGYSSNLPNIGIENIDVACYMNATMKMNNNVEQNATTNNMNINNNQFNNNYQNSNSNQSIMNNNQSINNNSSMQNKKRFDQFGNNENYMAPPPAIYNVAINNQHAEIKSAINNNIQIKTHSVNNNNDKNINKNTINNNSNNNININLQSNNKTKEINDLTERVKEMKIEDFDIRTPNMEKIDEFIFNQLKNTPVLKEPPKEIKNVENYFRTKCKFCSMLYDKHKQAYDQKTPINKDWTANCNINTLQEQVNTQIGVIYQENTDTKQRSRQIIGLCNTILRETINAIIECVRYPAEYAKLAQNYLGIVWHALWTLIDSLDKWEKNKYNANTFNNLKTQLSKFVCGDSSFTRGNSILYIPEN